MKAALIGYGYWGKILRRYIEDSRYFTLSSIVVRELTEHGEVLFTDDLSDVLLDGTIEAAFICVPASLHGEICAKLLSAGKHVFCEKPLTKGGVESAALLRLAVENGRMLFTDYIYTMSPSVTKAKELLPGIGPIFRVEGRFTQFGRFYPGESVWDVLGVHLLAVTVFLLRDRALCLERSLSYPTADGWIGEARLFSEGTTVLLTCNLLGAEKERRFTIHGENGSIALNLLADSAMVRLIRYEKSNEGYAALEERQWSFDEADTLRAAVGRFAEAITGEGEMEWFTLTARVEELMNEIHNSQIVHVERERERERKYGRQQVACVAIWLRPLASVRKSASFRFVWISSAWRNTNRGR